MSYKTSERYFIRGEYMKEKIDELEIVLNKAINQEIREAKEIYEMIALDIIVEIRGIINGENSK